MAIFDTIKLFYDKGVDNQMKAYIPTYLKKQNRTTVLDLFLEHKELTRADVSKLTGISLPTVLKIVDFLRMKQILIDKPDALTLSDSGLGRDVYKRQKRTFIVNRCDRRSPVDYDQLRSVFCKRRLSNVVALFL